MNLSGITLKITMFNCDTNVCNVNSWNARKCCCLTRKWERIKLTWTHGQQWSSGTLRHTLHACLPSIQDLDLISPRHQTPLQHSRTTPSVTETSMAEGWRQTVDCEEWLLFRMLTRPETETIKNWSRDRDRSRDFNIPSQTNCRMDCKNEG